MSKSIIDKKRLTESFNQIPEKNNKIVYFCYSEFQIIKNKNMNYEIPEKPKYCQCVDVREMSTVKRSRE